ATRLGENPDRGVESWFRRSRNQRVRDVVDAVREIAEARGVSMAQVALAWLVDRPTVTSVILGARTLEQLDDNLGAADLHLASDEAQRLDEASDPGAADYPYGTPGVDQRRRSIRPSRTSDDGTVTAAVTPAAQLRGTSRLPNAVAALFWVVLPILCLLMLWQGANQLATRIHHAPPGLRGNFVVTTHNCQQKLCITGG